MNLSEWDFQEIRRFLLGPGCTYRLNYAKSGSSSPVCTLDSARQSCVVMLCPPNSMTGKFRAVT